ncbi:hypothetical protein ACH0BF_24270 [Pseudobacillus sp. 179-B 2D1 NHS]|uniref:hypothetical protein n=1 Tax=Pseudobacillus sp. 179-B 2D1 NHS TaxID=3374292 RepID=UPI00387A187D
MEHFFDIAKSVLSGIVRELSAYIFRKTILKDKEESTPCRGKQKKGGSHKK